MKQWIRKYQREILDTVVSRHAHTQLADRAENFVSLFERHLGVNSRVLDIGGGWGFYSKPLRERGHQPVVIDVVKPGYQKAPVVIYNGERLPFADNTFDAAMFITVLHHIPDPEKVILEAKRVTKKTLIIVEDIYHNSLGRWWTVLRDRLYNFEYVGHPCRFKKSEEWIELVQEMGFTLREQQAVYTWLSGLRILNGVFVFDLENES